MMRLYKKASFIFGLLVIVGNYHATSQNTNRNLYPAVPVLMIGPDSRSAGMGDIGVASTPDPNSSYWNNAKYAVIQKPLGVALSYSPWLYSLGNMEMNLLYLSGYGKVGSRSTVAGFINYFSYGKIPFKDAEGNDLMEGLPNEFFTGATYSMQLTDKLSAGLSGKYIHSNLTDGVIIDGEKTGPGYSVAADLGVYYTDKIKSTTPSEYALGLSISNLGAKMTYKNDTKKNFLPTNLRFGGRYTTDFDAFNRVSILLDFNKLLIPTPPIRENGEIISGMEDDVSILQGVIQSFYDAPGGFKEELQEVQISIGGEYVYAESIFARLGYFYENPAKGGRNYLTVGGGIIYNNIGLNVSYLVPLTRQDHPLKNTLRFTLSAELSNSKPNPNTAK